MGLFAIGFWFCYFTSQKSLRISKNLQESGKFGGIPLVLGCETYLECSYYQGIATSGTNSKRYVFMWSNPSIRIQPIPTEPVFIPNKKICFGVHIPSSFGIGSVGINTRVIRAPRYGMFPLHSPPYRCSLFPSARALVVQFGRTTAHNWPRRSLHSRRIYMKWSIYIIYIFSLEVKGICL